MTVKVAVSCHFARNNDSMTLVNLRMPIRSPWLALAVLVTLAGCGNNDSALEAAAIDLDRQVLNLRTELDQERERADGLEQELADAQRALAEASAPATNTPTTTSAPGTTTTTPAPTPSSSDEEAIFRLVVTSNPEDFEAAPCEEDDVDCVVEAALTICKQLRDGDIAAMSRLSRFWPTFDDDAFFYGSAIDVFCPDQRLTAAFPPVILPEGVFAVVEGAGSPPRDAPAGTYRSTLDRGSECFWERRSPDGAILDDAVVAVVDRATTLTVTVSPGETFYTFGCRFWMLQT